MLNQFHFAPVALTRTWSPFIFTRRSMVPRAQNVKGPRGPVGSEIAACTGDVTLRNPKWVICAFQTFDRRLPCSLYVHGSRNRLLNSQGSHHQHCGSKAQTASNS